LEWETRKVKDTEDRIEDIEEKVSRLQESNHKSWEAIVELRERIQEINNEQ
jgi:chaperonin cofactor prefoldin